MLIIALVLVAWLVAGLVVSVCMGRAIDTAEAREAVRVVPREVAQPVLSRAA